MKEYPLRQCPKSHAPHAKRHCPTCASGYYAANRERISEYKAAYRASNKEQIAAKDAKYYIANKEQIAKYQSEYNALNKERVAKSRAADAQRRKVRDAKLAEDAADVYIAHLLHLPVTEVPPELLEVKRLHILIMRELKK